MNSFCVPQIYKSLLNLVHADGVTKEISQTSEANGGFVYLVGCDESGCSVNSQLTKADWQQPLEPLKSGKFGPFADLLSKWTDSTSDAASDADPWNNCSTECFALQTKVLNLEEELRRTDVDDALKKWEYSEKLYHGDANTHIVHALPLLETWQQKVLLLGDIKRIRTYEASVRPTSLCYKVTSGEEAGEDVVTAGEDVCYKIDPSLDETSAYKRKILAPMIKEMVTRRLEQYKADAEFQSRTDKLRSLHVRMDAMQTMRQQLFKQQGTVDVNDTLWALIQTGQDVYATWLEAAGQAEQHAWRRDMHKAWADALNANLEVLWGGLDLHLPDADLPREPWRRVMRTVDYAICNEGLSVALSKVSEFLGKQINICDNVVSALEPFRLKLVNVFGDVDEPQRIEENHADCNVTFNMLVPDCRDYSFSKSFYKKHAQGWDELNVTGTEGVYPILKQFVAPFGREHELVRRMRRCGSESFVFAKLQNRSSAEPGRRSLAGLHGR
eukprot:GHVS01017970.1.p1 GENE.GHVS01017970.1~~GHVS01017970.1.p1  ORF type:complete len:499 (-),score=46.86 GHVS01017970.1:16-1512(-)